MENGTKHSRPDGIAHLTTYLGSLMRVNNIHLMSDWPSSHPSNIQIGVPSSARHMVIQGCHVYAMSASPTIIVAAVQFLQEGGDALQGFEYVPMTMDEVLKAVHGHFKAGTRLVFVSNDFHTSMHTDSFAANTDEVTAEGEVQKESFLETNTKLELEGEEEMNDNDASSDSDDEVLSSLAVQQSTESVSRAGRKRFRTVMPDV